MRRNFVKKIDPKFCSFICSAKMSSVKVSKKSVSSTPVSVAAPVATPAPVATKAKRPVDAPSRSSSPASPAPVVALVEQVVQTTGDASKVEGSLQDELKNLHDKLTEVRDAATLALQHLKRLGRKVVQEVKDAGKRKKGRKAPEEGEVRKPSNFEKPVGISYELAMFFGATTTEMSRTEVNKRMFTFAKDNHLTEGQVIHLESTPELLAKGFKPSAALALRTLLGLPQQLPQGEKLTLFSIQKHMSRHYTKNATA